MVIPGDMKIPVGIDNKTNVIMSIINVAGIRRYLRLPTFGVGWAFGQHQVPIRIIVGGILELAMGKEGLFDAC